MAKKEEKPDTIKQLFGYAGNYRYLTIASWVLATISAFVALVPFYFIWRLIKEVLRVAPIMAMRRTCLYMAGVPLHLQ